MIQSALLTAIPNVRHGFFTRQGGHSAGIYASLNCGFGSRDDEAAVQKNRELVAARLGVDADRLMTVWQSHSPDVVMVEAAWDVREPPDADAMVTRRPGIALGVLTADCTPILFADREGRAVGVAHAGWKGAVGGVLGAPAVVRARGREPAKRRIEVARRRLFRRAVRARHPARHDPQARQLREILDQGVA